MIIIIIAAERRGGMKHQGITCEGERERERERERKTLPLDNHPRLCYQSPDQQRKTMAALMLQNHYTE